MSELTALFLCISIFAYVLFGGADYGAGILELFTRDKKQKKLLTEAIAPVWEANHIWLIIAIVILFMGFPPVFHHISIFLHVPLILLLLGITARGCAFTFRYYDPIEDRSHTIYTALFTSASVLTPVILGICFAAMFTSTLPQAPSATSSFWQQYITPWITPFSLSCGLFMVSLFTYIAAVYMTGEPSETNSNSPSPFAKKVLFSALSTIVLGFICLVTARVTSVRLLVFYTQSATGLVCVGIATILFLPLWYGIRYKKAIYSRLAIGGQVFSMLSAFFWSMYPNILTTRGNTTFTIAQTAAPDSVLKALLGALFFGICFILPALAYLLFIFKTKPKDSPEG